MFMLWFLFLGLIWQKRGCGHHASAKGSGAWKPIKKLSHWAKLLGHLLSTDCYLEIFNGACSKFLLTNNSVSLDCLESTEWTTRQPETPSPLLELFLSYPTTMFEMLGKRSSRCPSQHDWVPALLRSSTTPGLDIIYVPCWGLEPVRCNPLLLTEIIKYRGRMELGYHHSAWLFIPLYISI